MLARDYVAISIKYYPADIREDDVLFLIMLNNARKEVCLRGGIKKTWIFNLIPDTYSYHIPINQGVVGVYIYSPQLNEWVVVPKHNSPFIRNWNMPVWYSYDPLNYEIIFSETFKPNANYKVKISVITMPENFSSWDDTERDIPEHFHEAVGMAYAKNLAMYDMQYDVAQFIDGLLSREMAIANAMKV